MMKHLSRLLLAALLVVPLVACDEEETTPTEETVTGTIRGTVTVEGSPLSGVTVSIAGATSQSATTGSDGSFAFSGVPGGSYGVTIEGVPSGVEFATRSKTTSITSNGQTVTVDFAGSYIRTSSISGTITANDQAVNGATVTLSGPQDATTTTDANGEYGFTGLRAGDYTIEVSDLPEGTTLNTTTKTTTLAAGQSATVNFTGVAQSTASVAIEKVTVQGNTNATVNPGNVTGTIDFHIKVIAGNDDVNRVSLLVDGEVIESQTFTNETPMAEVPGVQAVKEGEFTWVATHNTADHDANTGEVPDYGKNGNHTYRAIIDAVNAGAGADASDVTLNHQNPDFILAKLTPEERAISDQGASSGNLFFGRSQEVEIIPVIFNTDDNSAPVADREFRTLQNVTVTFTGTGASRTVTGPFPTTTTYNASVPGDALFNYQSAALNTDQFAMTGALYSDGTGWGGPGPAMPFINPVSGNPNMTAQSSNGNTVNIDNVAPPPVLYTLTEQVQTPATETHPACCSNNWVGPDYPLANGLSAFTDATPANTPLAVSRLGKPFNIVGVGTPGVAIPGVGKETMEFYMGPRDNTDAQLMSGSPISTPSEAGVAVSMVNDKYRTIAVVRDGLGNFTVLPQLPSPNLDNPHLSNDTDAAVATAGSAQTGLVGTAGYDNAAPTNQALSAGSQGNHAIYNIANDGTVGAPMNHSATEDRAGLSMTPIRTEITQLTAAGTTPLVGNIVAGALTGPANESRPSGLNILACGDGARPSGAGAAPTNNDPCVPDGTLTTNAYYTVLTKLVDQAGNVVQNEIERQILKDDVMPQAKNVNTPPDALDGGQFELFTAEATDALDVWNAIFSFNFDGSNGGPGSATAFVPFGPADELNHDADGDGVWSLEDRFDGNLVQSATAQTENVAGNLERQFRFVRALETTDNGGTGDAVPDNNMSQTTNVKVQVRDAAGNTNTQQNNLVNTSVDPNNNAQSFSAASGNPHPTQTFSITAFAAAQNLCNGQGSTACANIGFANATKSLTVEVTATGASGTYPNPFGGGRIYLYYVLGDTDGIPLNEAAETVAFADVDVTSASFMDDGTTRTYTWTLTIDSDDVATVAGGTAINLLVIGANGDGDGLASAFNTQVTVRNGS